MAPERLIETGVQRRCTTASLVYQTKNMKNHHGGMVQVDGYLYGSDDPGILTCLDLKTGNVMWQERSVGKGSVTYADGHLYVRSEAGRWCWFSEPQGLSRDRAVRPAESKRSRGLGLPGGRRREAWILATATCCSAITSNPPNDGEVACYVLNKLNAI